MSRPSTDSCFLFHPKGGHSYYRDNNDGTIWLTDDSGQEFFQVDTRAPIVAGSQGFMIPLVDGRSTPAAANEVEHCAALFKMQAKIGATLFEVVSARTTFTTPAPVQIDGAVVTGETCAACGGAVVVSCLKCGVTS